LMLLQKDTLSFWYLAAGAAGGALTKFDLSGEAPNGGFLMAGISWTFDGGSGVDDFCAFITSEGDVIVYKGTNPSSAADWLKVGTYFIGKPLGRRCLMKYGGDVLAITQNGAFALSSALQSATVDYKLAISYKIENAFNRTALTYGTTFGWKAILYPTESALIVNVPIAEDGEHEQYVMNTITKSWCKFKEWDAEDFAVLNNELYYVAGTSVFKAWTGRIDVASNIEAYAKTAFSHFNNRESSKQFKLFRPILMVNGTLSFLTDIDIDYQDQPITSTATYSVTSGAQWNVDNWDVGYWASGLEVTKGWTSPAEYDGKCAAGKLKITTSSLNVQWTASDYVWETGGLL